MNVALQQRALQHISWATKRSWWLALGGAMITCLLSTPSWMQMVRSNPVIVANWEAITWQSEHLLAPLPYAPEDHNGQILYRILVPVMIRVSGLPVWVFLLGQYVLGVIFIRQLWLWAQAHWGAASGGLLWLAWVLSYPVKGYYVDVRGYFDGLAWFLLWRVFRAGRPWEACLLAFLATQVDERAYLVLSFVVVHHLMWGGGQSNSPTRAKASQRPWPMAAGLAIAMLGGLALRVYGRWGLGLAVESGDTYGLGLATLRETLSLGPLPLISGLDLGVWLLPVPALIAWRRGQPLWALVWMGGLVASFLSISLVLDGTRSFAYLGIVALIGAQWLPRALSERDLRTAAWCLAIGAATLPTLFTVGSDVLWIGPVFFKVFSAVLL